MDDSSQALYLFIAPLIAVGIFVLLGFFRLTVARRWNRHKAETVSRWEAEGVQFVRGPVGGQFGGLESMGAARVVRGIGLVVLTGHDVRVTRATPSAAWIIPFRQIKSVLLRPEFLGKTGQKTPFIVVRFVQGGQADRLGFQVKDYMEWAQALADAAGVPLKDLRNV